MHPHILQLIKSSNCMGNCCQEVPRQHNLGPIDLTTQIKPPAQLKYSSGVVTSEQSRGNNPQEMQNRYQDNYAVQDMKDWRLENLCQICWIDNKIESKQNQSYINSLRQEYPINTFKSVQQFFIKNLQYEDPLRRAKIICSASLSEQNYQDLSQNSRVLQIYLFCQNKQKAQKLIKSYSKIKSAKYNFQQLKQTVKMNKKQEYKSNILFALESDFNLMNKYRINFYSLIKGKHGSKAKKDYKKYIRNYYQCQDVTQFINQKKFDFLKWISKDCFYYSSLKTLPQITVNPKKLAYIRYPFKNTFQQIQQRYRSCQQKYEAAYVILEPNQDQRIKLERSGEKANKNQYDFIIFTSFVKAFSNEKKAKEMFKKVVKKNPKSLFVKIQLRFTSQIEKQLDFGYCELGPNSQSQNLIFNVMNVYSVQQVNLQDREVILKYGALAELSKSKDKSRANLPETQQNILRNFDYIDYIQKQISNQAKVLQMNGFYSQSIQVCNKNIESLKYSKQKQINSQSKIDEAYMCIGDAYLLQGKQTQAEREYNKVSAKNRQSVNIRFADLYAKTGQKDKLKKIIEQLEKKIKQYEKINKLEFFKAKNHIAIQLMNEEKFKDALKSFRSLQSSISQSYNYSCQGVPLLHQVQRNRAACQSKLQNYSQALGLLRTTLKWQQVCQGKNSPKLIATESLIKSLHESMGSSDKAKNVERKLKILRRNTTKTQIEYVDKSQVLPNFINQSKIDIQLS